MVDTNSIITVVLDIPLSSLFICTTTRLDTVPGLC